MMTMTPDVDEAGSIRNDCTIIVTLKRIGFRSYNFCFCKVNEAKVHIPNSSRSMGNLIVRNTLKTSCLGVEVTFLVSSCPDNLL